MRSGTIADLSAVVIGDRDFRSLEGALEVFCPFEAVGVVRQEIRHSHFLSYVLNPRNPHGLGSLLLESFVRTVAEADDRNERDDLTSLDVYLGDFSGTEVRREWRNIDFMTITPMGNSGLVMAVELKIESGEHGDQLRRARAAVERTWPGWTHRFVFLTASADDPSEEHGDGWATLGLDTLLAAFEADLELDDRGSSVARSMVRAYIAMLRRRYLTDERLEELAAALWARHPRALAFLADRRPDFASNVLQALHGPETMRRICDQVSAQLGVTVIEDHSTLMVLRFAIKDWDSIEGYLSSSWTPSRRLMLFELWREARQDGGTRFKVALILGRGPQDIRTQLYKAIQRVGPAGRTTLANEWHRIAADRLLEIDIASEGPVDEVAVQLETKLVHFIVEKAGHVVRALSQMARNEPT